MYSVCNTTITKYKNKREVLFKYHCISGNEPAVKSILQESNIVSINAILKVDLLDKI